MTVREYEDRVCNMRRNLCKEEHFHERDVNALIAAHVAAALNEAAIEVQRAKPYHPLRNYTPVDAAYDDAARIVRAAVPPP